jgi:ribosomal protein S18 acetylase RimI-like enzyme
MKKATFKIIPYESKFAVATVKMRRKSKELALKKRDKHSDEEDLDFFENYLSVNYTVLLALESNQDEVVGILAFQNEEISQLYIHPDFQGQGIGSKLLNIAKDKSSGKLWLFTFEVNLKAQRFYEKHGFRIIGRGFENEENLPDIKYEWVK